MLTVFQQPASKISALLASDVPVYLSVNPIEYHGPHLSLENDGLISRGLIHEIHTLLQKDHPGWPLLFAGEISAGVDAFPVPGSQKVSYSEVQRQVNEVCQSLVDMGAKRVVIMTFHGSPLHNLAITHAVNHLQTRSLQAVAPFNLLLHKLLDMDSSEFEEAYACVSDEQERRSLSLEAFSDFHAGFHETSLALHYAPESVHEHRELPPCPPHRPDSRLNWVAKRSSQLHCQQLAKELRFLAMAIGWARINPHPGYTGRPHLATAEAGAFLAQRISSAFAKCIQEVFDGRTHSPQPPMPWMPLLTLGGRFGKLPVQSVRSIWPNQIPRA